MTSSKLIPSPLPPWAESAVFYEIYPQTFHDSNSDGIGDLPGITAKLDYVASLGVTAIWLNPFYKSPMRDAGYDVADFRAVDPRYGTLDDLRTLFAAARARGLRVIIDFVPGHTSIDHPWFQASARAEPNPCSNWFIWTDSAWDNGGAPWREKMVHGYSDRNGNYLVNFFWSQPALNFGFGEPDPAQPWQLPTTHPDVRRLWDEMRDTMVFWMEQGADGFRVDMAGSITRRDPGGREARRFWAEARAACEKINPDYFTVAEWSHPKSALDGRGLHADFLHWIPSYENLFRKELARTPGGPRRADGHSWFDRSGRGDMRTFLDDYLDHYHATLDQGCISIPVGNHDLPRIAIDRDEDDLTLIFAFLLTMPGVPFIYYGDEIGMRHLPGLPTHEGCYPPRAGARTPMQWDPAAANLGFSTASAEKLWYPVDPAPDAPTVSAQQARADSLLHRVRTLIALRRDQPALRATAAFTPLYCERDAYPFVYLREGGGQRLLIVLNPAARPADIELSGRYAADAVLAGTDCVLTPLAPNRTRLEIAPVTFAILSLLP
jgi:glycosidase